MQRHAGDLDLDAALREADSAGADALARARRHSPIAVALVNRFEELVTKSAAVLRAKAYETMAEHGVDVGLLVQDARARVLQRRRARVRHARRLNTLLKRRVESGEIARELARKAEKDKAPPPSREEIERKVAAAQARLAAAPKRIAEYERIIAEVMRRPKQFSTDPTPERRAHAGEAPRVIRTMPHAGKSSPRAHRFDAPLERLMQKLTSEEYNAADRLRWAHENRTASPRVGDYGNGAGRTSPSERLGLTDKQQKAAQIYNFFWPRLPPALREMTRVLLFHEKGANGEAAPTAEEWGMRYGRTSYHVTAKAVSETALRILCVVLAAINRDYAAWRNQERELAEKRREERYARDRR